VCRLLPKFCSDFFAGRCRDQGAAPHEQLKAQLDEWNRRLQSLETPGSLLQNAGKAASSKDKEEAVGEVARAFEKLLHIYGQNP
jgi:hypothetical protein